MWDVLEMNLRKQIETLTRVTVVVLVGKLRFEQLGRRPLGRQRRRFLEVEEEDDVMKMVGVSRG